MSQSTLAESAYFNSNLFSGYYLDERVDDLEEWDCDDEAEAAFEALRAEWEQERDLVETYKEDELLGAWIDEVLDVLGFGSLQETTLPDSGGYNDRLLFRDAASRREGAELKGEGNIEAMYSKASAVLEAKQWNADFGKRFNEHRSYRDASHQIKYYLERTPEPLEWGILTDGRKWRLYGTKDYATETYYEIDLPELLESGNLDRFKYFYAFFRPEAFDEVGGTTFLDTVWSESETAAQELGEDLQDNVFTALRILGEGFVETNDLDIDPDDEAAREELKEQSLVLLYRLMFVLYAESRHLIHPDDPDSQDDYEANFSLDELRLDIHHDVEAGASFDDFSEHSTQMWSRLEDLFRLVDNGEESLGIPPYNGGLFDDDRHDFLAEHDVANRYIAEVIYRLGTTETDGGTFVLADYADLDTRHLGSIYEGLLEHEFRIASEGYAAVAEDGGQVWKPATEVSVADAVETVESGELYVVNDDGERKATGAYYTPDYVVAYIVEETIGPLLDDIKADLESEGLEPSDRQYFAQFWQEVLDLKILDPAMGSGHFLTKATGYLTEQVMEVVREQEIQSYDEQDLRREIAKECIYGVDINGMATELAKLSMWLETLAADQPLAFLDHHLKTGNSLVGSDITEVLSNDNGDSEDGQITIFQAAARVQQQTLQHVMDLMQDLLAIDNETLEDIKSMEEIYDEIRDDPLYQRLFALANVHTAEHFGVDVPEGAYEDMAQAIEDKEKWAEIAEEDWFIAAQATAEEEDFFHWELEYPEVFFDIDGGQRADGGFDVVAGNPPWVNAWEMTSSGSSDKMREVIEECSPYEDILTGHWDLYVPFLLRSDDLLRENGILSYIIPNAFCREKYAKDVREHFLTETTILKLAPSNDLNVFSGVSRQTIVPIIRKTDAEDEYPIAIDEDYIPNRSRSPEPKIVESSTFLKTPGHQIRYGSGLRELELLEKIDERSVRLGTICYVNYGAQISSKEKGGFGKQEFLTDEQEEGLKKFFEGKNISRYHIDWPGIYLDYRPSEIYGPRHPSLFESPKIAVRYVSADGDSLLAAYDDDGMYTDHLTVLCTKYENVTDTNLQTNFEGFRRLDKPFNLKSVLAILNSKVDNFYYANRFATGSLQGDYSHVYPQAVRKFPLPDVEIHAADGLQINSMPSDISEIQISDIIDVPEGHEHRNSQLHEALSILCEWIIHAKEDQFDLNLSLLDHLGNYSYGPPLSDIGLTQPPEGAADSILHETTEQKPNLRVGEATVVRESPNTVEIRLTARYKPDDDTEHETDQWGYTATDPLPALRITDLSETEADLIEAFVPVAVDEAGGFADFRETATKTNSLIDRLRKLTLPAVDDVREGLASYRETTERAEELEATIERTDALIDEIVYELYGLTDEEIEIVEDAVAED